MKANTATLPATLHFYYLDTRDPDQLAQWNELKKRMRAEESAGTRGHKMHSHSGKGGPDKRTDSLPVQIELAHMFENQWNTAPFEGFPQGYRAFDFYQHYEWRSEGRSPLKRGHWLELTPELIQARRETVTCQYCGKHYGPFHEPAPASGFCQACLDSPYLKQTELHLLRLRALSPDSYVRKPGSTEYEHVIRPPLTAEEQSLLVPLYIQRQTTGNDSRAKARIDKQRADVIAKHEKETRDAQIERDGMLWLWEKGMDLDNVLFYSHTQRFGFGWRSPLGDDVVSALLDIVSEFPFAYEIKGTSRSYDRPAIA